MAYESTRTFRYPKSPEEALADLQKGFATVGMLDRVHEPTATVVGHCRVSRPWPMTVRLRGSVLDGHEGHSVTQINAYGSDIWESGARRALDLVEDALERLAG